MNLFDDLRHGLQGVLANKASYGFAALILACGLGLAIAMWCVIDAVLVRTLPYANAERIVQVRELTETGNAINVTWANYRDLAETVEAFEGSALYAAGDGTVAVPERAIRVGVAHTVGEFFAVLGQAPALGQTLSADGHAPEAVIGHGLWQRLFEGRADVLGRGLEVNGTDYTIVGVMPPGFDFPQRSEVWVSAPSAWFHPSRSAHNWSMLALLREGEGLMSAQAQSAALADRLVAHFGEDMTARGFDVAPLAQVMTASVRRALQVLSIGVGFLLLVAVTNAINLLLAVAIARGREFALRAALGASRTRLWRQCLAENLFVTGLAWLIGMAVAGLGVRMLLALAGDSLPRADEIAMTPGIVLVSALLALALAAAMTLATRIGDRDQRLSSALREGGRGQSAGRSTLRTRVGLLVAQTALTTCLLVGAVLLGRSFLSLLAVDPGYADDGAVRVQLSQPWSNDAETMQRTAERYDQVIDELSRVPGVTAVGGVSRLPLTGGANGAFWDDTVTGFDGTVPAPLGYGEFRVASAGYFDAVRIPLMRGRLFDQTDRAGGEQVALVSQQLARSTWGELDPIGRRIQVGNMDGDLTPVTIVGVVGDVREQGLDRPAAGSLYVNLAQRPGSAAQFNLVVRGELALAGLMPLLRERLEQTAAWLPYSLHPLSEVRAESLAQHRFNLVLLAVFAGAALLLAGSGLYGLMAFSVRMRSGEFAVRQALGASAAGIGRLVLRGGLLIAALGIGIGIVVSLAASQLLVSLLHGVSVIDPVSYAAVAVCLLLVAGLACLLPAWRAIRTAPTVALD